MFILVIFSFFAGVVTILSPCILPILPIILSSTVGSNGTDRMRPLGVILGFIVSFTFFTLFLSTVVRLIGISPDALRTVSIVVIAGFGLSLLVPRFQLILENAFSKLSVLLPQGRNHTGLVGGILIGLSLGLLWTPCVGPILASVISLALTGSVTIDAFIITLAYSIGTAIPMFLIMIGGQRALTRVPWIVQNTATIQKAFGIIMILTAIGIYFNIDRRFQTYILDVFPSYGTGLTRIEDNSAVLKKLDEMQDAPSRDRLLPDQSFPAPNPTFEGATRWLQSQPLSLSDELKGKVVLVDFWTYTCINCIRTFPYLKSWYKEYKDDGFVIVGVHTPEFEFEKDTDNVEQAMKDFGIEYPVVQDNDYRIWQSYENRYWPAHYLIDREGKVRYTHFGEGKYDETEDVIRTLLKEGGTVTSQPLHIPDETPETVRTPESYLGYARIDRFFNQGGIAQDRQARYTMPSSLPLHSQGFGGKWTFRPEHAESADMSQLNIHFQGKEVYLVMKPSQTGNKAYVEVFLDGRKIPAVYSGTDVNNGKVTVEAHRLYRLVSLPQAGSHVLQLKFTTQPIQVFAFTFG